MIDPLDSRERSIWISVYGAGISAGSGHNYALEEADACIKLLRNRSLDHPFAPHTLKLDEAALWASAYAPRIFLKEVAPDQRMVLRNNAASGADAAAFALRARS